MWWTRDLEAFKKPSGLFSGPAVKLAVNRSSHGWANSFYEVEEKLAWEKRVGNRSEFSVCSDSILTRPISLVRKSPSYYNP